MPEEKREWQLTKEEMKEFAGLLTLRVGDYQAMEALSATMGRHAAIEKVLWDRVNKNHAIPDEFREKLSLNHKTGKIRILP